MPGHQSTDRTVLARLAASHWHRDWPHNVHVERRREARSAEPASARTRAYVSFRFKLEMIATNGNEIKLRWLTGRPWCIATLPKPPTEPAANKFSASVTPERSFRHIDLYFIRPAGEGNENSRPRLVEITVPIGRPQLEAVASSGAVVLPVCPSGYLHCEHLSDET